MFSQKLLSVLGLLFFIGSAVSFGGQFTSQSRVYPLRGPQQWYPVSPNGENPLTQGSGQSSANSRYIKLQNPYYLQTKLRSSSRTGSHQLSVNEAGAIVARTQTEPQKNGSDFFWVLNSEFTVNPDDFVAFYVPYSPFALAYVSDQPMVAYVMTPYLNAYYLGCVSCSQDKRTCTIACMPPTQSVIVLYGESETTPTRFKSYILMSSAAIYYYSLNSHSFVNQKSMQQATSELTQGPVPSGSSTEARPSSANSLQKSIVILVLTCMLLISL